jgi:ABC-type multidrug transport system fused ATPase/permease subunit
MRLLLFLVASAVHAAGHAALAFVASGLAALALSRGPGLVRAWGRLEAGPFDAASTPHADKALVLSLVGLGAVFVKGAAGIYATYVQRRVAGEVGNDLRLQLLDALLAHHRVRAPWRADHGGTSAFVTSPSPIPSPATAVSALTDRIREVELGFQNGLLGGTRAVSQLVPLAVVLFVLSQRLAVFAVLLLAAFGVLLGRVRAGYRGATRMVAEERERLLGAADECVRHAELWVTFGAEGKARGNVRRLGEALGRRAASLEARASALGAANEVLAAAALVAALAAGRAGWLGAGQGEGALLAFAVAFFMAYRPLRDLAEARLAWARACTAYDDLRRHVGAIAPAPAEPVSRPEWPLAALELCALRLARGCGTTLSLNVAPGAIVAVCGATGAGKTTLLRTLLGLEGAIEGEVRYAGAPLTDAAGPAARPFAWVPQEAPLLADTLSANVALGACLAPEQAAAVTYTALGELGADRLLSSIRAEERLGPGGRPVSGGERQWIAIARAVATGQPVLLLDEPTSGLDAESQGRVLAAIERLRGRRTVILVTHRPEPLAIADAVVHLAGEAVLGQAA